MIKQNISDDDMLRKVQSMSYCVMCHDVSCAFMGLRVVVFLYLICVALRRHLHGSHRPDQRIVQRWRQHPASGLISFAVQVALKHLHVSIYIYMPTYICIYIYIHMYQYVP